MYCITSHTSIIEFLMKNNYCNSDCSILGNKIKFDIDMYDSYVWPGTSAKPADSTEVLLKFLFLFCGENLREPCLDGITTLLQGRVLRQGEWGGTSHSVLVLDTRVRMDTLTMSVLTER